MSEAKGIARRPSLNKSHLDSGNAHLLRLSCVRLCVFCCMPCVASEVRLVVVQMTGWERAQMWTSLREGTVSLLSFARARFLCLFLSLSLLSYTRSPSRARSLSLSPSEMW